MDGGCAVTRYRPQVFREVFGQDYPVRILSQLIKKSNAAEIFFFMAASRPKPWVSSSFKWGREGMGHFGIAFLPGGERFGKLG